MRYESGQKATSPQDVQRLEQAGFFKCRVPVCDYYLSPAEQAHAEDEDYFFSCPNCKRTYSLMDATPFGGTGGGPGPTPGIANREGETVVGLTMKQQGDLAEELVQGLKTIEGYGPITWWSPTYNDPIDGGCGEWAIEVKAICIDAKNHRFVPGPQPRKDAMIARAKELGFKGVLGLLVILDYRRSVADIYSMEMPLDPWYNQQKRLKQGPVAFRKKDATHLIAEVPFTNPFLNPQSQEPQSYDDIPF